jgi:S1-C subfamily serine protease
MFSKAYKIASNFTLPVIVSSRFFDGTVESGLGSFILLNSSGWILTASHIVQVLTTIQQHQQELINYKNKVEEIEKNSGLTIKQKRSKINSIHTNGKWLTNLSFWWGADTISISQFQISPSADIAIGKIDNFKPHPDQAYPKFRNTDDTLIGASLCKLGFPFHDIKTTFNEATASFSLPPGTVPVPRFPIDGIGTRFNLMNFPDGSAVKLIETSSPGLRGQSGGPIFDIEGNICAMQIKTNHYPLGFNPEIEINGRKTVEPQFINVGVGVTSETILSFLNANHVAVEVD